jgi:hypothetical protein
VIATWQGAVEKPDFRQLTLELGIRAARGGREAKDWGAVKEALTSTEKTPGSLSYWRAVADRVARDAGAGVFMEEETLAVLVSGKPYESEFWERVTLQTPRKNVVEGSWRATCWCAPSRNLRVS